MDTKYISQSFRLHVLLIFDLFIEINLFYDFYFKKRIQLISKNKLKTDYPCDLTLWFMFLPPKKNFRYKMLNHSNLHPYLKV